MKKIFTLMTAILMIGTLYKIVEYNTYCEPYKPYKGGKSNG